MSNIATGRPPRHLIPKRDQTHPHQGSSRRCEEQFRRRRRHGHGQSTAKLHTLRRNFHNIKYLLHLANATVAAAVPLTSQVQSKWRHPPLLLHWASRSLQEVQGSSLQELEGVLEVSWNRIHSLFEAKLTPLDLVVVVVVHVAADANPVDQDSAIWPESVSLLGSCVFLNVVNVVLES